MIVRRNTKNKEIDLINLNSTAKSILVILCQHFQFIWYDDINIFTHSINTKQTLKCNS